MDGKELPLPSAKESTNAIPRFDFPRPYLKNQEHQGLEQEVELEMGKKTTVGDVTYLNSLESHRSRQLIDKLREHGLDKHIELPQVAIMGDTSSGKSSVLSALSGITFPSSHQLTTRCPTQLVLSYGEEFCGSVSLKRYQRDADDRKVSTEIFSKEEITDQIEKLTKQLVDEGQKISDDSIVINVSGPEFPNLTLIDLPGLVRTVETGEDSSIIQRIQALVYRYLRQTRTVILAVVPANVDMHNTGILQDAEDVDPYGNRTQAIITKLDLVDEGGEQSVIDLLLNKRKKLRLGYHAVKCRGQKELNDGVSIQEGIEKEKTFFQTSKIWSRMDIPKRDKGIGNLRIKLVALLERIIHLELPNVIREIDVRLTGCRAKLSKLGEPMDSAGSRRLHYSKAVEFYYARMEAAIKGMYNIPGFFQASQEGKLDNRFRAIVRKNDEFFQKEIHSRLHKIQYVETEFDKLSPWDTIEVEATVVGKKSVHHGRVQSINLYSIPPSLLLLKEDGSTEACYKVSLSVFRVRKLDNIMGMISSNRGDELTIFVSQNVFCSIVQNYVDSWEGPTMELFGQYYSNLSRISQHAIQLLQCRTGPRNYIEQTVASILEELKESLRKQLRDKLESERRPYTLNPQLRDILTKLRSKPLLDAFRTLGTSTGTPVAVSTVLAILEKHGLGSTNNDYHVALETEEAVIAYLQVASTTFIDEIPKLLNDYFLMIFLILVKERLNVTDDVLEKLLTDSDRIVQMRNQLKEEEKSLLASKKEVFQMK